MFKHLLILLLFTFINLSTPDSTTDSKISKYLKQCGFLNSLKVSKCVLKSTSIDKEIKKLAKNRTEDFSKLRTICEETTDCLKNLKCPPAEIDNASTLNFCWRVIFQSNFQNCSEKLIALKSTPEGACLADFKSDQKNSEKDACYFLRNSKDCMKKFVTEQCGNAEYENWDKFARGSFEANDCERWIGLIY